MEELLAKTEASMVVRGLSAKTRETYLGHLQGLAHHYRKCPSEVGVAEVEAYLLHLTTERRWSPGTRNQCASALSFFYRVVLDRPECASRIPRARGHQRLPAVLSGTEVQAVLSQFRSVVHHTLALLCYGAGLRLSEACTLCIADIDSKRGVLHIRKAKGHKDRLVTLSPRLLAALRQCWKQRRPQGPYRTTVRYLHLTHARRKSLPSPLDLLESDHGAFLG